MKYFLGSTFWLCLFSGVAFADCATVYDCAKDAAASAKAANEILKAMQDRLSNPPTLDCQTTSADSDWGRSPTVVTLISPELGKQGYVRVSGGCELAGPEPGNPGARAHNGPITASRPNGPDGWYCRAMDPPNISLDYSVRAWAVYCKFKG